LSVDLQINEWNLLKGHFRALVRDESMRAELQKFLDSEIRRRFGEGDKSCFGERGKQNSLGSVAQLAPIKRVRLSLLGASALAARDLRGTCFVGAKTCSIGDTTLVGRSR
jgi:hypothetical protein